jgi:hypothetical protein
MRAKVKKIKEQEFNKRKFVALILHILSKALGGKKPYTLDTLGNTMAMVDFAKYAETKKSITGAHYVKTPGGFFPSEIMTLDLGHLFALKAKTRKKGKR